VTKLFDMAKKAAGAMKQTMSDFEDNATSPPNSERQAPEQQENETPNSEQQARKQQRNVSTERGGMPIVDLKLIENANRKVRIEWPRGVKKGGGPEDCAAMVYEGAAQKQVCELINKVVENKIESKKGELENMTKQAVENIRTQLEATMLDTINNGFNEKIKTFYKQAVDTPESDVLLQAIIGEMGMKFNDALANGLDTENIDAYRLAIQALQTKQGKKEEALVVKKEGAGRLGGKKTKKKPSKTIKKKPSKTIKKKPSKTIKKKQRTRKKR